VATSILGWEPDSLPEGATEPPAELGGEPTPTPTEGAATPTPMATPAGTDTATPEGDGAGGPVPQTYLVEFREPGVYDFLCSPHEAYAMVLRVVVGDVTEAPFETSDPTALPPPRGGRLA
jgi:hypothetical protein